MDWEMLYRGDLAERRALVPPDLIPLPVEWCEGQWSRMRVAMLRDPEPPVRIDDPAEPDGYAMWPGFFTFVGWLVLNWTKMRDTAQERARNRRGAKPAYRQTAEVWWDRLRRNVALANDSKWCLFACNELRDAGRFGIGLLLKHPALPSLQERESRHEFWSHVDWLTHEERERKELGL